MVSHPVAGVPHDSGCQGQTCSGSSPDPWERIPRVASDGRAFTSIDPWEEVGKAGPGRRGRSHGTGVLAELVGGEVELGVVEELGVGVMDEMEVEEEGVLEKVNRGS